MSARSEFSTVLTPGTVLALCDFETTGVDPNVDHAIEVGILFLDDSLTVVGAYESLIQPPAIEVPRFFAAFRVHGIAPQDLTDAPAYLDVAGDILRLCRKHQGKRGKIVLASDNVVFETAFMRKLFAEIMDTWPFHYCGWDTSLLLEATKVGDPKPRHRAMADVGLVYRAMLKAFDRP